MKTHQDTNYVAKHRSGSQSRAATQADKRNDRSSVCRHTPVIYQLLGIAASRNQRVNQLQSLQDLADASQRIAQGVGDGRELEERDHLPDTHTSFKDNIRAGTQGMIGQPSSHLTLRVNSSSLATMQAYAYSIGNEKKKSLPRTGQAVAQREGGPTVGGFSDISIEGGGNFLELISDAYDAFETRKSGETGFNKFSADTKAVGSILSTAVSGLAVKDIETGTACLESLSEGLKIFDACKEVGEAWGKVSFRQDTYAQTLDNLGGVLSKLGDVVVGAMKSVSAFCEAMQWLTGKIKAFADWAPISECLLKGVKFLAAVKSYLGYYTSYKTLQVVMANSVTPDKQQIVGYLIDEQWSRLKNGVVTVSAAFVDFAADTVKYFPSLGINVAWSASMGAAAKAAPLLHRLGAGTYDTVRHRWRNAVKSYVRVDLQPWLAATDKADLKKFQDQIVNYVLAQRNQPNSNTILESIGLGQSVAKMDERSAKSAIEEAISAIK